MKYIRENAQYVTVPDGYEQTFVHPNFTTVSGNAIMKLKEDGTIDNDDIEIVAFVYGMRVVTKQQVVRFCQLKAIENGEERLESLCSIACLNKFFFTTETKYRGTMPADMMYFYCLQTGGTYLLKQFKCVEMLDWTQADNCMCSRLAGKYVLNAEIYLEMRLAPKALLLYDRNPFYMFTHYYLFGGAIYGFRAQNGSMEYLQTDIIRTTEDIKDVKEKLRRYESLLVTKSWRRYYHDSEKAPTLVLFTDNDDAAYSLAKEVYDSTKIRNLLVSTDERILRGIRSDGSFLIYDEEEDALLETRCQIFE